MIVWDRLGETRSVQLDSSLGIYPTIVIISRRKLMLEIPEMMEEGLIGKS